MFVLYHASASCIQYSVVNSHVWCSHSHNDRLPLDAETFRFRLFIYDGYYDNGQSMFLRGITSLLLQQ
jgi:hypothetical protein